MIVPGGGISLDGQRWISSRPAFLLPVRVLGTLFRRLFLTRLIELHDAGDLPSSAPRPVSPTAALSCVTSRRSGRSGSVVYAKPPFAGPEAVLAYLSRYTHRVAISNQRLIAFDETGVTFRYKDYRRDGAERQRVMTLAPHEFIRRFLLHVLPRGFHRIRHYGLLASFGTQGQSRACPRTACRRAAAGACRICQSRSIGCPPCPCCGGRMIIIETFERWRQPRAPPHGPHQPGAHLVTRHGLHHPRAAATSFGRWPILCPMSSIAIRWLCFDHHSSTRNRRAVHQYRNEATRQTCNGDGRTVLRIGQKSHSP